MKTFKSTTTTFIKATQIKINESDSQSLTKVLYYQKPLQINPITRQALGAPPPDPRFDSITRQCAKTLYRLYSHWTFVL